MTDRDEWLTQKDLESAGVELHPGEAVRLHGRNETPEHLAVKAMVALAIRRSGRRFDTEVKIGGAGRADVVDLGPPDGKPVVYEIETGLTPKRAAEKASQYTVGPIRDAIPIDPERATHLGPAEILEWLQGEHGL